METSYVRGTQSFPRTWWRPETPLARIAREKTGSRCQVPGPVRQRADILEIAMVFDNAKLLLRLLWRPADAMSGILDQGSLLFASLAVLAVSLLVQYGVQSVIPRAPVAAQHAAQPQETEQPDEDQPALPLAHAQPWWSFSFYAPLLVLAVVYVPGTLLV